ncbi:hypothetical protein ANHYDRO_01707 [Anaerococcus hydrogenalis DSM 7454]|uniref:Uncharacterized protein n=1 Tax=Anaerococcus hydrogenalis DSM 7454 TaxID=561177 RepID=B6WAJ1_9FIRM|nr:hypothetical protein ANHYDRO_01707 [Anaerococcus hydrogenalis DSM 7454]
MHIPFRFLGFFLGPCINIILKIIFKNKISPILRQRKKRKSQK